MKEAGPDLATATVDDLWSHYEDGLRGHLPPPLISIAKSMFYAGFDTMLKCMFAMRDMPDIQGARRIHSLSIEIGAYRAERGI